MPTNKDWERLIHEISRNAKQLIFTDHALDQMRKREISLSMALDTLRNGQIIRTPKFEDITGDTKCRMERYCGGKCLRIVVAVTGLGATRAVVIPAFT